MQLFMLLYFVFIMSRLIPEEAIRPSTSSGQPAPMSDLIRAALSTPKVRTRRLVCWYISSSQSWISACSHPRNQRRTRRIKRIKRIRSRRKTRRAGKIRTRASTKASTQKWKEYNIVESMRTNLVQVTANLTMLLKVSRPLSASYPGANSLFLARKPSPAFQTY
jgi:hypothetical protein